MGLSQKHFLSIADYSRRDLEKILDVAVQQKDELRHGTLRRTHIGRTLACIFHKPSLRTRVSFEVAMHQLGGTSLYLTDKELGIGSREAPEDVARVFSRYVSGIMIRTFDQGMLQSLAEHASIPIINGLTNLLHPCQVMADLLTIREHRGDLRDKTVVLIGDGNNMSRSWVNAAARLGFTFILACPPGYGIDPGFLEGPLQQNAHAYREIDDPIEAVSHADVVYTDVWTSMGQESETAQRLADFRDFQVSTELMSHAPDSAIILHCLPAHRGEEITNDAMESEQSVVFDQAENRLHVQRAILSLLIPAGYQS